MSDIGHGATIEISANAGTSFTDISDSVRSFTFPSASFEPIDVTTFGSPNRTRQFINGMRDNGETTIETLYVQGDAADLLLDGALDSAVQLRLTPPGGTARTWNAIVTGYTPNIALDDVMVAETTLRINDEIIA